MVDKFSTHAQHKIPEHHLARKSSISLAKHVVFLGSHLFPFPSSPSKYIIPIPHSPLLSNHLGFLEHAKGLHNSATLIGYSKYRCVDCFTNLLRSNVAFCEFL